MLYLNLSLHWEIIMLKSLVKYGLRKVGLDIHKYTSKSLPHLSTLSTLFSLHKVDLIFDIEVYTGMSTEGFRSNVSTTI